MYIYLYIYVCIRLWRDKPKLVLHFCLFQSPFKFFQVENKFKSCSARKLCLLKESTQSEFDSCSNPLVLNI